MSRKTSKENILPSVARDLSFFTKPLLLRSECEHEFDELLHALSGEIQPRGIVENLYVEEIAGIIWDILRLRRCKVTIMNMSFEKALHKLISSHFVAFQDEKASKGGGVQNRSFLLNGALATAD